MTDYEREDDVVGSDIISSRLFKYEQVQAFFKLNSVSRDFCEQQRKNIRVWTNRLSVLLENADKLAAAQWRPRQRYITFDYRTVFLVLESYLYDTKKLNTIL